MELKLSIHVDAPDAIKKIIRPCLESLIEGLEDVSVTDESRSTYHIDVFVIEGRTSQVYLSTVISQSRVKRIEFLIRKALIQMWERLPLNQHEQLPRRPDLIREIVADLDFDHAIKTPTDHWPMVTTVERLPRACEKIVAYCEKKTLGPARAKEIKRVKAKSPEIARNEEDTRKQTELLSKSGVGSVTTEHSSDTWTMPSFLHDIPSGKISSQRTVKAADLVRDIVSGLGRVALMKKYRLSARGVSNAVGQLLKAKALSVNQLSRDLSLEADTVEVDKLRAIPRLFLDFELQVYDGDNRENRGTVRDINENGVGVHGIRAQKGQVKTLVILGDEFGTVAPFEFKAECRWVRMTEAEVAEIEAGFMITEMSEMDRAELEQLIRGVTFEG